MRWLVLAALAASTLYWGASALALRDRGDSARGASTDSKQRAGPASAIHHPLLRAANLPLASTEGSAVLAQRPRLPGGRATSAAPSLAATATGQVSYTAPSRYLVPGMAGALGIGDVTGDLKPDVVVAVDMNLSNGRLLVFGPTSTGALEQKASYEMDGLYSHRWGGLVIGDFNRDQVMDVAVGMPYGVAMFISGGGTLTLRKVVLGRDIHQLVALDVNYDGYLDIVGLSWGNIMGMYEPNAATVLRGDGAGGILSHYSMATPQRGYNDLKLGDVTSDGHPDLVIASGQAFNIFVIPHDGVSGFLPARPYARPDGVWMTNALAIGDVNSDGRADVVTNVWSNSPVSSLWIYHQGADRQLLAPQRIDSMDVPGSMLAFDLNNDGLDDIATVHEGWNELGYYLQTTGGLLGPEQRTRVVPPLSYNADHYNRQGMAAGDLTADGCPDIALGDYNYGLVVLEGRGCLPPRPRVTGGNNPVRRL